MNITASLKKRFCRDFNVNIAIFEEPYFTKKLNLVAFENPAVKENWNIFTEELSKFDAEEEYFSYCNFVKEWAISSLKNSEYFQEFNTVELLTVAKKFPKKNLYSQDNVGCCFISVDLREGNFTALRHYNPKIFDNMECWEDWIGQFTDLVHIKKSNYMRQAILGACSPVRQEKYAERLMSELYWELESIDGLELFELCGGKLVFKVEEDKLKEAEKSINEVVIFFKNMFRVSKFKL